MPRVPPFDRPATYEDLLQFPEEVIAEILDGELHVSPRAGLGHSHVASALGVFIGGPYHHRRGGPGGWWILDEPELHLAADILIPDIAGWRRTRLPSIEGQKFCTIAPDWVCEVLSPSTAQIDRTKKLRIYARERVPHLWLIDPAERTLEALGFEDGRWTILAVHSGADTVRAEPFSEIEIELASLWPA